MPQPTWVDSLSPRFTGDISFEVAAERISQVVLLTEEELIEGARYCLEELHLVAEPAGAAGITALLAGKVKIKRGPACVVVSGSNLDKKYFREALGLQLKERKIKTLLNQMLLLCFFLFGFVPKLLGDT